MSAGLLGALAVAALLKLNAETGFMPELDVVGFVGEFTGTSEAGGWVVYFIFAAATGALFAWLDPDLPGDSLRQRGMILSAMLWFLSAALLMPLGGLGVFGFDYGVMLPLASLALHLLFGAVMGGTYGWLLLQNVPLRFRQPRQV